MAKFPLRPGDIERLEHDALERAFHRTAEARGVTWVRDFVYPDWLMRKYIAEYGTQEA